MPRSIIFVVDDESAIVKTLVLILNKFKDEEFLAFGTDDIAAALTIVRGIQPDLVLLDVLMPGVKELEHAIEMRDKCGCKILLMSGNTHASDFLDRLNTLKGEPFSIVAKPIHPVDLVETIRTLLQQPRQVSWQNPLSFVVQ